MIEYKEFLEQIYQNSINGQIPTEDESAELKGFFKELIMVGEKEFYDKLAQEFPVEFGEALDEMDKIKY